MADEQTIAIAPLLKMQQKLKANDSMLSGPLFVRYSLVYTCQTGARLSVLIWEMVSTLAVMYIMLLT